MSARYNIYLYMIKKKKRLPLAILIALAPLLAAWGYLHFRASSAAPPVRYETATVTRGDLERVIVSSGTLDPIGSVEVGTQVSGTIEKVLVDFNDEVRPGQIIAEIDKSVLMSTLSEARASLSRAEALFSQSEQEFKRGERMIERGLISEQEFLSARTNYLSQQASLQVAKAAVNTASENVRYATIRSPVKGTVIARKVEVGQTVAASMSAPTLFIIAEDLKNMQIMAQVDETDIGRIRPGQPVRFGVQAYPRTAFAGVVEQVRLQPQVVQNVVTYSVVIRASNADGTLLPGMTANVEFVEAREEGVLIVPNAALLFAPPHANNAPPGAGKGTLWRLIEAAPGAPAEFAPLAVALGLSDGVRTSVSGEGVAEGLAVVVGEVRPEKAPAKKMRSIIPQQQKKGPPPRR